MFACKINRALFFTAKNAKYPTLARTLVRNASILANKSYNAPKAQLTRSNASASMPVAKAADASEFYAQVISSFVKVCFLIWCSPCHFCIDLLWLFSIQSTSLYAVYLLESAKSASWSSWPLQGHDPQWRAYEGWLPGISSLFLTHP